MSIDCTSNVWKLSSGSKNQLLLMLAIADYADDSQYCWPGQEKLAERLRMTERGVRNLIAEMCESGDLWKARRGSVQSSNAYIVLVGITQQQLSSAADKADAHNCDSAFLRALLFRMVSDNILELTPEVTRELIKLIEDREVKEEKFSSQTGTIFPLKPERSFRSNRNDLSSDPSFSPPLNHHNALHSAEQNTPQQTLCEKPPGKTNAEKKAISVSKLLRGTLTTGEDEEELTPLSEYIKQQFGVAPTVGQRKKLAMRFTEKVPGKHDIHWLSPDEMFNKGDAQFMGYLVERVMFVKSYHREKTSVVQRSILISTITKYKDPKGFGFLDYLRGDDSALVALDDPKANHAPSPDLPELEDDFIAYAGRIS